MNLEAKLTGIKPYSSDSPDGEVILKFDSGETLIMDGTTIMSRRRAIEAILIHAGIRLIDAPAREDDWREFVQGLFDASISAPTPVTQAPAVNHSDDPPLCTRAEAFDGTRVERNILLRSASADDATHSVDATLSTQGAAVVFDPLSGSPIQEVLIARGASFADLVPLLDAHNRSSVASILGSVRNIRVENDAIVGRLFLSVGNPDSDVAWLLIRDGSLNSVSVGYQILQSTTIRQGTSQTIDGVNYEAEDFPLRVVTKWALKECSLVPIGADPAAKTRAAIGAGAPSYNRGVLPKGLSGRDLISAGLMHRCGIPVRNERIAESAEKFRHMSLVDVCREALKIEGREAPRSDAYTDTISMALRTRAAADIFTDVAGAQLVDSYEELENSTAGWVDETDVDDFKPKPAVGFDSLESPEKIERGQTAALGNLNQFSASGATIQIARYGRLYEIDEQDVADDNLDAITEIPRIAAATCGRLAPDLVYSLLLANGKTVDGIPLFDASHGNLATGSDSALSAASIQAAVSAMALQTMNGVTLNRRAKFLILPAELRVAGAAILKTLELLSDDDSRLENLKLRSDARAGASGCVSPATGLAFRGTSTNWFLASDPIRTIRVAYLKGTNRRPTIRGGPLSQGRWGIWIDVKMEVGASILGSIGLYKSAGA